MSVYLDKDREKPTSVSDSSNTSYNKAKHEFCLLECLEQAAKLNCDYCEMEYPVKWMNVSEVKSDGIGKDLFHYCKDYPLFTPVVCPSEKLLDIINQLRKER